MKVYFADRRLRDRCADDRELRKEYGAEGAKKIRLRLAVLAAAESLDDVMRAPGKCHPLQGDRAGCYAMMLHAGWRLVFQLFTGRDGEESVFRLIAIEDGQEAPGAPGEVAALATEIVDYHG
ncbi:type II toxin-antitoxin system RelE/ParE family toxin [Actinomadura sp. NPDC047616]|uniref:type II toxin-antitoxin system RelE/ParE family toxin n=1 Tax=Actinomadura sp. NPDC047616 TaxID=3155914 RepID=UPI0033FB520C